MKLKTNRNTAIPLGETIGYQHRKRWIVPKGEIVEWEPRNPLEERILKDYLEAGRVEIVRGPGRPPKQDADSSSEMKVKRSRAFSRGASS